jgi:hypothetical protein
MSYCFENSDELPNNFERYKEKKLMFRHVDRLGFI